VTNTLLTTDPTPAAQFDLRENEIDRFKYGKIYPCIDVSIEDGTEVSLLVNLGDSEKHPFLYKGPFPPFPIDG